MANFEFASNAAFPRADKRYFPCKASTTFNLGDPVVLTTESSLAVLQPATSGNIGTLSYGFMGFAAVNGTTDSSGIMGAQIVPSGVSAAAAITYNIPQYGFGQAVDAGSGRSLLQIFLANSQNEFWGKLKTASSTVAAAELLVGKDAGFDLTSSVYTVDQSTSNTKCLVIIGYDPNDLTRVKFRVKSAYQQLNIGTTY